AGERGTCGAARATRQSVQVGIADSRVEIDAARGLGGEAAWKQDNGKDPRREAAAAKLFAVEAASRVVDRMIQVMGALGLSKELPLEAWYRDLRVARVIEGSSEILRMFVARAEIGPAATGKR